MKTRKLHFLFMLVISTASVWAQFPTTPLSGGGDGTIANPYKIATAADLIEMRNAVNSAGNTGIATSFYELTDDIDMSDTEWTIPIGSIAANSFLGKFDGKGHSITNLYCGTQSARRSDANINLGLFGIINGATIKNLSLNVSFYVSRTGLSNLGGLVSNASGGINTIDNCRVGGVININSALTVGTNQQQRVAGIIAQTLGAASELYITNCFADVAITNIISDSPATGNITNTAQILGDAGVVTKIGIVNCLAGGSIAVTNNKGVANAGGILGVRTAGSLIQTEIINCCSYTQLNTAMSVNTNAGIGGIAGNQNNAGNLYYIKNSIALNPAINYVSQATTVPTPRRIGPKTTTSGAFTDNYALTLMNMKAWKSTSTEVVLTPGNDATSADGANLAGADSTAQIADGLLKLNAYVTSNPSYAGIATTTFSPVMLNTWSAGAIYPSLASISTPIAISSNATEAAIVGSSADIVITGNGTALSIGNDKIVNNITVNAGSKLNFTAAKTLTITGDLLLKADLSSSFSANIGTGTLAVSGAIKYLKTIDDQKWYFISLPTDVTIANITGAPALGTLGTDWFIKYYDGAKRGISGTGSNWTSITAADVTTDPALKLNKYQGYIIGLKTGNPLTEFSFPLVKAEISTESTDRSIAVASNTGAAAVTNHGWNLIGQPYLSNYVGNNATGAFNIYVSDGTSTYTAYTKATVPDMKPMSAYFIQASNALAGTGVSFGMAGRQLVKASFSNNLMDEVKLSLTNQTGTDYALLTLDNDFSTDYEIGYDLEKWVGTGTDKPQIYTQLNDIKYAFNALSISSVNNLPVGIYTKNEGNMTISANAVKAPSLTKLLLTDNGTQPATVTDLLLTDYNFTADAGTNNSRFVISAQRVSTGNVIETESGTPSLLIDKSKITIQNIDSNAVVQVYDALGRMIENISTNNGSIEITLTTTGVYTVKINKGIKNWTKKIVI